MTRLTKLYIWDGVTAGCVGLLLAMATYLAIFAAFIIGGQ